MIAKYKSHIKINHNKVELKADKQGVYIEYGNLPLQVLGTIGMKSFWQCQSSAASPMCKLTTIRMI